MVRLSKEIIMMKVSIIVQTQNLFQFMSYMESATHQMELEMENLKVHPTGSLKDCRMVP